MSHCLTVLTAERLLLMSCLNLPSQFTSTLSHPYHCIKWIAVSLTYTGAGPKVLLISASMGFVAEVNLDKSINLAKSKII